MITFGTTNRDSAGQNPLNKINSTPQFTIGFNAPYLNKPNNNNEKKNDENKVTKLIKSLIPFDTNEDIEENFTNENDSTVKLQKGNSKNNEDSKSKEQKDEVYDVKKLILLMIY